MRSWSRALRRPGRRSSRPCARRRRTRARSRTRGRASRAARRACSAASTPRTCPSCCTRSSSIPAGTTSRNAACRARTARWSARPASAHTVSEVTDLDGNMSQRVREWDSCFQPRARAHRGGNVPPDASTIRYRQWLTHKLASWIDQFGTSGCVGCGRCITWCPVGIDLTEEVAAIRGSVTAAAHDAVHLPPGAHRRAVASTRDARRADLHDLRFDGSAPATPYRFSPASSTCSTSPASGEVPISVSLGPRRARRRCGTRSASSGT